jgi:hypothetical protein
MPRAHRPFFAVAGRATLLFGLLACHPPSSRLPIDELEKQSEQERTGEAHEQLEPLPVEAPTDLLPEDVPVLVEVGDTSAVLAHIRRLDKFPEFQSVHSQMSAELGVDLLDPEAWQQIGLDRHGPVGFAMLDIEAQGWLAYASLTDARAFGQFIERLADRNGERDTMSSAEVGHAFVYRLGEEASVILRENVAMFVFVDRPERVGRDYVATIATLDPREALSHSKKFAWAREQVEVADDGLVFVNASGLFAQIEREIASNDSEYGTRYAQEELDRARSRGESAERIKELEQRVEEERVWQLERAARQTGERELARAVFGPIEAFVLAGELRDESISAHARMLIPGEGLLARMFVPMDVESPLLSAVDQPPLTVVDGRVDMQSFLQLVELLARTEGEELQDINAQGRDAMGVDLLADVIPLLTGTGGVMVTQMQELDVKHMYDGEKNFGLAAYVGVSDPERVRKLLDGLLRSKRVPELSRQARGDGWVVAVPDWHDVVLTLVGDRLVASTDPKLAERIRDARPGTQKEALADPEHPLRGRAPTPALRVYQRWLWLVASEPYKSPKREAAAMLYELDTHSVLTPEQAAAVPRSREFKRKYAELERRLADLDAFDHGEAVRRYEQQLELGRSLGDAGMQIERLADGLGARAVWRMAPGTTPLEIFMRMFMGHDGGGNWQEYERISQDVNRLRDELMMIRRSDLDAAAAKLPH